jgi:hypothetical protein
VTYQETVRKISATTEQQVLEAYRAYGMGRISRPQFVQLSAAIVAKANNAAVAVADVAVSVELARVSGTAYGARGVLPKPYDQARLQKGVRTLLDDLEGGDDVTDRIARFARSEPLTTATNTFSERVSGSDLIEGWVRQLDGDPCQLCRWWWREGRVWNKNTRMQHHKGCSCTQRIVMVERNT